MSASRIIALAAFGVLTACSPNNYGGGVAGYSRDRCAGSYNQCRNDCLNAPDGAASAACYDRCLASESRCYTVGDDGARSTLSQDDLIGRARDAEEKQADYERWKARRDKEREAGENAANPSDSDAAVTEIRPGDIEVD